MDYLQPSVVLAKSPLVTPAKACPPVINIVLRVTRKPRTCLWATSARYMGSAMLTMPNRPTNHNIDT